MANPWLHWWSSTIPLLQQPTFPRLLLALVCGCVIGAERQWRQRAAGMRTNTLVCFGAAAFVDLGATVGGPTTTNVIAYVISGVGFLGAGAIMKEGGSIRGLNTAATLWCSAAVGACAGAGEMLDAVFVTALLVAINILLRPLSRSIDRRSLARTHHEGYYRILITCARGQAKAVSELVVHSIAALPLTLHELRTEEGDENDEAVVHAVVQSATRDKVLLSKFVDEIKADSHVGSVEWSETTMETD